MTKDDPVPAQIQDEQLDGEQLPDEPTPRPSVRVESVVDEVDEVDEVADGGAEGADPAEPDATPAGPARLRLLGAWLRGHVAAVLAGLVVVGLVVGLVLTTLALRHANAVDDARASALDAGKQSAVALGSYDYRTLDRDFRAVTDRSTPRFRDSFTQTSASLRSVLEQYDATATSTVVSAGVVSASEERAVVLVFLNQTATNTNQKAGPTTDQSRVQVALVRDGERWLIDEVTLL